MKQLRHIKHQEYSNKLIKTKIEIWITLNSEHINLSNLLKILSKEELNKADTFLRSDAEFRFIVSRALIRTALSYASGGIVPPKRWRIRTLSTGKPWAVDPDGTGDIYFNLSHAGTMAAVAVSLDNEVGIDVEPLGNHIQPHDIWAVLTERERFELAMTAPENRSMELIRTWTMKESYLKLLGTGLNIDPGKIDVGLKPMEILADRGYRIGTPLFTRNWIMEFDKTAFSLSLAAWKTGSRDPDINFHLFDPTLKRQSCCQLKNTSGSEKEEQSWKDYIIYSSDAAR